MYDKAVEAATEAAAARVRHIMASVQGQRCGLRAASRADNKRRDLPRIALVTGRSVTPHGLRMMQIAGCDVSKVIL